MGACAAGNRALTGITDGGTGRARSRPVSAVSSVLGYEPARRPHSGVALLAQLANLLLDQRIFLALLQGGRGDVHAAARAMTRFELQMAAARTLDVRRGDVLQGLLGMGLHASGILVDLRGQRPGGRQRLDAADGAEPAETLLQSPGLALGQLAANHYRAAAEQRPRLALVDAELAGQAGTHTASALAFRATSPLNSTW
jgi:hypothetical protein